MGALHEGHAALMRKAAQSNTISCLSLFVNPTQFGPNEDYSRYPRTEEADLALAERCGITHAFIPSVTEMYPANAQASVKMGDIANRYEGAFRPGHFDGVATVVHNLFTIIRPKVAYFGLKDLQQCAVIEAMVHALFLDVTLSFEPTIREDSGLALSSRNRYLSNSEREQAVELSANLLEAKSRLLTGDSSPESILEEHRNRLIASGWAVDYFDWIQRSDFSPARNHAPYQAIVTAARLGTTRLIDNVLMD